MKCETCGESVIVERKRFCNESCRAKFYANRRLRRDILQYVKLGRYDKITQTISKLVELGFIVQIREKNIGDLDNEERV